MNLVSKITPEFLFFSLEDLKLRIPALREELKSSKVQPISKYWFVRISYLIRSNKIIYNKFIPLVGGNFILKSLKVFIIQNSFFLLLRPVFDEYIFFSKFYSSEYF